MKHLPKGIRLDRGYVQVRIFHKGKMYCKNFGQDSDLAREAAIIHLSEKRKEILFGMFGHVDLLPEKTFAEVAEIWLKLWCNELNPDGLPAHTEKGKSNAITFTRRCLMPYFKALPFHEIKPKDVLKWRLHRLTTVLGTSVNREQAVLSSIFSHINRWVKTERIKAFKLPPENPCQTVEKAQTRKRERVLTTNELGQLKQACHTPTRNFLAGDTDMWEICKMALKSMLRLKDLQRLEVGHKIDMTQAKTGVRVNLPIQVLKPLNYANFKKRWELIRQMAGLHFPHHDPRNIEFRDLRKTGANLLKQQNWSNKIISEVLGHTNTRTTEVYMVPDTTHLAKPLADLASIVDKL